MKHRLLHIIICCLLLLPAVLFVSCSRDAEDDSVPSAGEMTLGIGFKIPARTVADGYEEGEAYENYIDAANGNYRIYFFDAENKLIARFDPEAFILMAENDKYVEYSVLGEVPEVLAEHSDFFKMVVLANWPQYDDANMKTKETTIADICNATWAQYSCLTDGETNPTAIALNPFAADPSERKLMPFYGVHEYSNVTFKPGVATILDEPVTLLRAMAKVEVILEIDDKEFADDLSFSSLKINRYNAKGYCAPKDVFTQGDYDHDEGENEDDKWKQDYVHTLHLVGNANDEGEKELALRLVRRWDENGKRYEKWTAYLPEYRNIDAGNAYSSIKAKFNIQLADDTPHTIYFANYSGGKTDNSNGSRLNIERNNIYRFQVTCTGYNFKLRLTVSDWEGLYENNFEYGDGQFTSPPAPWDDEINNEIEF